MSITAIIIITLVVLSPVIWFMGGILFKILWGYAPLLGGIGGAAYLLWKNGLDWVLALPVGLMLGIALTWLWQRNRLFLTVDRWVETHVFFDK